MSLNIKDPADRGYAHPEHMATTDWLAEHLDDPNVVVVDQDLPDNYARVHIPGAVVYKDHYYKELSDTPYIQDAWTFAMTMESLGIGDNTTVIAYDSDANHVAARLFWALKYYGHEDVKILDGGFPKWLAEGKPLSRKVPTPGSASFTSRPQADLFSDKDEVLACTTDNDAIMLDVRSDEERNGTNKRGTARGGRIGNSVHIEWKNFITDGDVPVIKPADELREILEANGVTPEKKVVTY
ncbi:MAG: sulfurtransferase [Chloroflexi bacterium]|mgnify:FL=1|nr:sulfurtransferase [Chloroflexota bacterium]MBT4514115.1 sulfurtransferase [Chloroflexota bacterium]